MYSHSFQPRMCSGDRSRSVYCLSCHGRRRIGIQRQREGRQSRTERDEKERRSDGNFLGLESDINEDNEDSEEEDDEMFDVIEDINGGTSFEIKSWNFHFGSKKKNMGPKKKAIDMPNKTRSTRNISEQSSEIPITTPSLPVSRVNYSTTTQPTESTQNEQEDLESTAPTKKRTRGQNRSKGTSKVVADTKSKLPVTARKGELHPVGDNASKLASEIGFIVRNHAPLKYKGWKNVPPEDKALIHTRIKDKFKIDPKEERHMHDVIERHCSNRYKNYRNQLHAHYKDVVKEGKDPLANRPLNHRMTDQDWHWLCDNIFGNPNWQKRSVAAAKNKAKVPYNHRGRSKSFIQHRTKGVRLMMLEKLSYLGTPTGMQKMVGVMRKQEHDIRQRQENNEEILEDEIRAEVLGSERCGHIPGLGPALHKKNSYHQVEKVIEDRVANMREEMRNEIRHEVRDEILQEVRNERQDFLQQLKDIMNIPNNHPILGIQQPPPPPPPPPPSPPSFGPPRVDTTSVPSPPPAARDCSSPQSPTTARASGPPAPSPVTSDKTIECSLHVIDPNIKGNGLVAFGYLKLEKSDEKGEITVHGEKKKHCDFKRVFIEKVVEENADLPCPLKQEGFFKVGSAVKHFVFWPKKLINMSSACSLQQ
ncbi:hypothetical protein G4B88_012626 [Cannabis sativa]|uniref:DUF8039 domain-containing protein n=1 Tax=Cannabis sativa TaxID=3483 RepID=A0A7J6EHS3_CANSA|nr:hypothetical protein G4B88_012626 [Cannabis sativa]